MSGGLKEGREEGETQRTSYIASFNPYPWEVCVIDPF